jgi:hypothetical protein
VLLPTLAALLGALLLFENVLSINANVSPLGSMRLSVGESVDEPLVETDAPEPPSSVLPIVVPPPALFAAARIDAPPIAFSGPIVKKPILLKSPPPPMNATTMQAPTSAIAKTGATRSFIDVFPSFANPWQLWRLKITEEWMSILKTYKWGIYETVIVVLTSSQKIECERQDIGAFVDRFAGKNSKASTPTANELRRSL